MPKLAIPNGSVESVVTDNQYAYIQGDFEALAAGEDAGLVAVNPDTGENLNLKLGDFDGLVRDILVTGSAIYVCGMFTYWRSYRRVGIAKFDLTGKIDETFDPGEDFSSVGPWAHRKAPEGSNGFDLDQGSYGPGQFNRFADLKSMAINGNSLYVGGYFYNSSGAENGKLGAVNLVKIDAITGQRDQAFRPWGHVGSGGTSNQAGTAVTKVHYSAYDSSLWACVGYDIFMPGNYNILGHGSGHIVKLNPLTGNPDYSQKWCIRHDVSGMGYGEAKIVFSTRSFKETSGSLVFARDQTSDGGLWFGHRAANGVLLDADLGVTVDIGRLVPRGEQNLTTISAVATDGQNYYIGTSTNANISYAYRTGLTTKSGDYSDYHKDIHYNAQAVGWLFKVDSSGEVVSAFNVGPQVISNAAAATANTWGIRVFSIAHQGGFVYATVGYRSVANGTESVALLKLNATTGARISSYSLQSSYNVNQPTVSVGGVSVSTPAGSVTYFIQNGRYLYLYGANSIFVNNSPTQTGGCIIEYDTETDTFRNVVSTLPGLTSTTTSVRDMAYLDGYLYAVADSNGIFKVDVGSGTVDSTFTANRGAAVLHNSVATDGTSIFVVNVSQSSWNGKSVLVKLSTSGVVDSNFTFSISGAGLPPGFNSYNAAGFAGESYVATIGTELFVTDYATAVAKVNTSTGAVTSSRKLANGARLNQPGNRRRMIAVGSKLFRAMEKGGQVITSSTGLLNDGISASTMQSLFKVSKSGVSISGLTTANTGVVRGVDLSSDNLFAYVCGAFTSIGGQTRNGIAKIKLSDMSVENWATGTRFGSQWKPSFITRLGSTLYCAVEKVGGYDGTSNATTDLAARTYAGTLTGSIVKLAESDASLDTSFNSAVLKKLLFQRAGSQNGVEHFQAFRVSAGMMLLSGSFCGYDYVERPFLAKVSLSTGEVDPKFQPQLMSGKGSTDLNDMAISPDGKFLYLEHTGAGSRRLETKTGLVRGGSLETGFGNFKTLGNYVYSFNRSATATVRTTGLSLLNAVAFSGSHYVAVGDRGTVLRSADGISWSTPSTGVTKNLLSVAYGGGYFVAVGEDGTALNSVDGQTWSVCSGSGTKTLYSVTYANSKFVAVGEDGTCAVSTDATTFSLSSAGTKDLHSITYGGSTFVAVGSEGTILTSSNASTWVTRSSGVTNRLNSVAYGTLTTGSIGSIFVAVGENSTLLRSADGISWTAIASPALGGGSAIGATIVNNHLFVFSDSEYRTRDLSTWSSNAQPMRAIFWNSASTRFVAVGGETPTGTLRAFYGQVRQGTWASGNTSYPTLSSVFTVTSSTHYGILRLDQHGQVDSTFMTSAAVGNGANDIVRDIVRQGSALYMVGDFSQWKGVSHGKIVKVNESNGSVASGWSSGTGIVGTPEAVDVLSNLAVFVGGNLASYNGVSVSNHIVKLDPNGTRDASFTPPANGTVRQIVVVNTPATEHVLPITTDASVSASTNSGNATVKLARTLSKAFG